MYKYPNIDQFAVAHLDSVVDELVLDVDFDFVGAVNAAVAYSIVVTAEAKISFEKLLRRNFDFSVKRHRSVECIQKK